MLVAETTWMRWFRLLFGATAPAASATLVGFLVGHALGAAIASRRAPRWRRPLAVYGGLELAGALALLLVPLQLELGARVAAGAYDGLRDAPATLTALRFALAVLATLPAAACFGATLPAIGSALVGDARRLGGLGAGLYAINTLGAAAGTALAAFFLPDWTSVRATYGFAVALLAVVGLAALALSRGVAPIAVAAEHGAHDGPASLQRPMPRALRRAAARRAAKLDAPGDAAAERAADAGESGWGSEAGLLLLAGISGFGVFAAQVLLVHGFAQVLNGSVYAFGAVLVVVLIALAAGAAIVAAVERRELVDPRTLLGVALAGTALGLAAFPALLSAATDGLAYVGTDRAWPGYLLSALGTVVATAGIPLLAASLVFPLVFVLAARRAAEATESPGQAHHPGRLLGRLAAASTAGSIVGALAAPFVLLPLGGPWSAFVLLGGLYALPAVAWPDKTRTRRLGRDLALGLGWVAVITLAHPGNVPFARTEAGEHVIAAEASASGVVAVVERDGERVIRTDNYSVLGGTAEVVHQERQGHLARLLHPAARRIAYVGSATGISAGAVLAHPLEHLHLVEIVPGVAAAAKDWFGEWNRDVYAAPATTVVLDDARNFLRATQQRFDLVVADLFVPWRAGTGALYAREHFEHVRARLEPDGVFVQWLPLYQLTEPELATIAATFLDVFPKSAVFRGDFYGGFPIVALVGYTGAAASVQEVSAAASALAARGETDRWVTDPLGPWALYVGPLSALATAFEDVPRNTDDTPRIEFLAARTHAGGTRGKEEPVVGPRWPAFADRLRAAAAATGDPVYGALPDDARRAGEGGVSLQRAGAEWVAGRFDAASQALAEASRLLPPRLVADAPEDPTAAEVWRD